jgi:PleD family two-component response regulator
MEFEYNKIKVKATVSIGLTQMQDGDDIIGFIERADELLYTAKDNGRNRVEY